MLKLADKKSDSYNQGGIDAIKTWAEACGRQQDCSVCPIGVIRGVDLSCQEFASKYPKKYLSLLREMNQEEYTYLDEYRIRFPHINLSLEEMIELGMCRKIIFEGYGACEESNCEECWQEQYAGDVTVFEEEQDNSLE